VSNWFTEGTRKGATEHTKNYFNIKYPTKREKKQKPFKKKLKLLRKFGLSKKTTSILHWNKHGGTVYYGCAIKCNCGDTNCKRSCLMTWNKMKNLYKQDKQSIKVYSHECAKLQWDYIGRTNIAKGVAASKNNQSNSSSSDSVSDRAKGKKIIVLLRVCICACMIRSPIYL